MHDTVRMSITDMVDLPRHGDDTADYPHVLVAIVSTHSGNQMKEYGLVWQARHRYQRITQ